MKLLVCMRVQDKKKDTFTGAARYKCRTDTRRARQLAKERGDAVYERPVWTVHTFPASTLLVSKADDAAADDDFLAYVQVCSRCVCDSGFRDACRCV
jgi:hypothetical protein